jgi:hypothetical protein
VSELQTQDLERWLERLRLRIDAVEVQHPDGRVLVFSVPGRPVGTPIETKGAYWMRRGESRRAEGCQLSELQEVLPSLSKGQVQTLLREMNEAGVVHSVGNTRAGRWFPGRSDDA